ncbi:115f36d7-8128-4780-a217-9a31a445979c [Thermothielavioides terrestris]|uniref:115f36d7-8128-4780-a217-9a31a445979c n=1 Tax=Thermothielavioides terrestris TaxID=2587410 RepID=A0A446BNA4_9PEZI|nr:115f36d7-8128-4780-a217-9a31a445979c [Thermothielavioides terrestris]
MVKIAVAGPGQVAHEIIDGLVATGKHDILLLARKDATPEQLIPGTTWVKVDYEDRKGLVKTLEGVHTVLSFIAAHLDTDNKSQKALIDAAIEAGVKRIAPSEWAGSDLTDLDWYNNKLEIRKYLEEKNREKKVIEYTLFQPGWFLNYIVGSRKTTKHIPTAAVPAVLVDHERLRARVAGDPNNRISYTAIHDLVNIVVKAIDYEGEWPRVGGINGNTVSIAEEIAIGEKVRGKPYQVETLDVEEVKAGVLKTSWLPTLDHFPVSEAEREVYAKLLLRGILLNVANGTAPVSDEWNRIFPDYKFTTVEEILTEQLGKA